MKIKKIKQILKLMKINEETPIDDLTYAVRTGENMFSICDNGEEVPGLTLEQAAQVAKENLS